MPNPYQSVDIRDELLFLGDLSAESLKSSIRECSNEIIGDIVYLVDVAYIHETSKALALFDNSKKITLGFICVTAENNSYSDPGVIRIYDISVRCNSSHTGLQFDIRHWSTLGEIKHIRLIIDTKSMRSLDENNVPLLEIRLGDKKSEFYTRDLKSHNAVIFIINKLSELYLKRPLQLKNIDINQVNEQAALDDTDSQCTLFNFQSNSYRRASMEMNKDGSGYDEMQELADDELRVVVTAIQQENPECSLEEVEQNITHQIDKSENLILEHLLEIEVNQSTEVKRLVDTVESVGNEVDLLENWLYKHNSRLAVMTRSLQTIAQENTSLTIQKHNHEHLEQILTELITAVTIDTEEQTLITTVDTVMSSYVTECYKWGKTASQFGVKDTLTKLPQNNIILRVLNAATKLRDVFTANTLSLCVIYSLLYHSQDVPIAGMSAVRSQLVQNTAKIEKFFVSAATAVDKSLDAEAAGKVMNTEVTCQRLLLLAPLLAIVKEYVVMI